VLNSEEHISNDKNGIYSEFAIRLIKHPAASTHMRKYIAVLLCSLCAVMIGVAAAFTTPGGRGQDDEQSSRRRKSEDPRWPIVDYDAPEPADPRERDKRKAKNARYNRQDLVSKPSPVSEDVEMNLVNDWEVGFPALPAGRSSVVLIGEVGDARAHLSEDKTGVYSEFAVRAERVLKNESGTPLAPGGGVSVERVGGRVRSASGHIEQYGIHLQGMPKVGGRYLLFLSGDEASGFHILTGYELKNGKVFPLDGVDPAEGSKLPQFAEHEGAREADFLRLVENTLSQAPAKQ